MSKIGIQSQSGIVPDLGKLLAKHPIAYLLLGNAVNLGIAQQIRAASPSTLILLRAQSDNWSLDAGVVDFANRSLAVAAQFQNAGCIDFLLPPNEPVVQNDVNAKRLNDQMVQIAGIYKSHGYKTLAYNFSVGNPDYPLWQYLNDGIIASDGWLGLHEYGSPSLQNDAANLSLRHRNARTFMSTEVQKILKVGIDECFIDLGATGGAGGYRALPNPTDDDLWWIKNLTSQLDWWDAQLALDPYVIFATGFGYAMQPPWDEGNLKFDVAGVDTDRAYYINWQRSGTAIIPIPPGDLMQIYQPYVFPKRLADIAWQGMPLDALPNQPFYRIQPSAGVRLGVSAYAQLCVVDVHGVPLAGVKVVNDFGDGTGELLQTDAVGLVQFNFGPSSAFTPPIRPPLALYIVDDAAWVEPDKPHTLHYTHKLSDVLFAGDTNGTHTQGSATYVQQVVMPDAVSQFDAIRLRAYPAKALTVPVYCAGCALQAQGRARNLGAVLSDEFYVTWNSVQYVAQGFAQSILATAVGHYLPSEMFTVDW